MTADPPHTSRRGALRVTGLNIAATFTPKGHPAPLRGVIADLSATGALLLAAHPLPVGQVIQLEFAAPKGPRIKGSATVARSRTLEDGRTAAGVAFDISVETELELAQWVFDRV